MRFNLLSNGFNILFHSEKQCRGIVTNILVSTGMLILKHERFVEKNLVVKESRCKYHLDSEDSHDYHHCYLHYQSSHRLLHHHYHHHNPRL